VGEGIEAVVVVGVGGLSQRLRCVDQVYSSS
jgi:hypothetical protein